jgi:hypothetical protein
MYLERYGNVVTSSMYMEHYGNVVTSSMDMERYGNVVTSSMYMERYGNVVTSSMYMERYGTVAQYFEDYPPNSILTDFQKHKINTAIHCLHYRHKQAQIAQQQTPFDFCFTNTNLLVAAI